MHIKFISTNKDFEVNREIMKFEDITYTTEEERKQRLTQIT
jgi:hypothetical protein